MTDALQRGAFTAQPTRCLRQDPRITAPSLCSLEITHAARLRARLQVGEERFVRNVWGVGYCLSMGATDV